MALNQSRKKKRKVDYGESVLLKKCNTEADKTNDNCQVVPENNVECHSLLIQQPECASMHVEANAVDISVSQDINGSPEIINNSETSLTFVEKCIQQCKDTLIEKVIGEFNKEDLLIHFMAFMNLIATGQLSVVNMAVLLSLELALLLSLASTTQMRYREDTALFWEVVLSVGGPRTLRLFSSDKHVGTVNSGNCEKSKYIPSKGNFNFTVPDEKILRKS